MNLSLYVAVSAIVIFILVFAFSIRPYGEQRDFNIFLLIGIFIFGGFIGWYLKSTEIAFLISILFSFVFL